MAKSWYGIQTASSPRIRWDSLLAAKSSFSIHIRDNHALALLFLRSIICSSLHVAQMGKFISTISQWEKKSKRSTSIKIALVIKIQINKSHFQKENSWRKSNFAWMAAQLQWAQTLEELSFTTWKTWKRARIKFNFKMGKESQPCASKGPLKAAPVRMRQVHRRLQYHK